MMTLVPVLLEALPIIVPSSRDIGRPFEQTGSYIWHEIQEFSKGTYALGIEAAKDISEEMSIPYLPGAVPGSLVTLTPIEMLAMSQREKEKEDE
jgi:hypothetical protein